VNKVVKKKVPRPSVKEVNHGLKCRKCGGLRFSVEYTRRRQGRIVRKRRCQACDYCMITWERPLGCAGDKPL
jgi:hypothetical protein